MQTRNLYKGVLFIVGLGMLAGCASSQMKARKEVRDRVSQSSRIYCDFVNGEVFPDVDVQMNIEMAKRCDSEKSFSVTGYRSSNENVGLVYCCALRDDLKGEARAQSAPSAEKSSSSAKSAPAKKEVSGGNDGLSE